jgi:hypothetical protein
MFSWLVHDKGVVVDVYASDTDNLLAIETPKFDELDQIPFAVDREDSMLVVRDPDMAKEEALERIQS